MIARLIAMLALLGGCVAAAEAPAPREIRPGEDACEFCHMSVDDPNRAAQWVETSGRVHTFDEPGCLVGWLDRNPDARGAAFVADAQGSGWVPAEQATFARGAVRTGMGFDILAYRDREAAIAAAGERGVVQSWSELREEGVRDAHAH